MAWLTWRQFRAPALVVYAALAAVALALALTGPHLAEIYRTDAPHLVGRLSVDGGRRAVYYLGVAVTYVLPALLGAFWGAPLVAREIETGTHKLVWNQGVTRHRWLATKFGWVAVAALLAGGIGLAVSWWCQPIDKAINRGLGGEAQAFGIPRLSATLFGARGVVPIGYAVLAFAIGVTAGLVLRRTVMAMAVTLAAVVLVQILAPNLVAPHLAPTTERTVTIRPEDVRGVRGPGPGKPLSSIEVQAEAPGVWMRANESVDRDGRAVTAFPRWVDGCLPSVGREFGGTSSERACFARLEREGYRQRVAYIAADRYWPMQWSLTAILLVVALGLSGFCFWWIRRVF